MQLKESRRRGGPRQEPVFSRRRQVQSWILVIVLLVLAVTVFRVIRSNRSGNTISAVSLPCTATQDVTVFGNNVLYYDGSSIHCLNGTGGIRWSFPVGAGARFSCSDTHLAIWSGTQLFIVDSNGNPSYNENMRAQVQFARIGSRYCAAVVGDDTEPTLLIRNMDGTAVDEESDAYSGMLVLDVGFYGEADQYLWTMAMDVYGTAVNTVLNTFQVGKMNTGVVNLGSFLAYKALYENGNLRVFTTQQMYTYDYKAVQDMSQTRLVYGWQLVDADIPERGNGNMLLVPTSQLSGSSSIIELRVLTGNDDRRYTLPSACVGAAIQNRSIYAVSSSYLYRADVVRQRFYAYALPLPEGRRVTELIGLTRGGRAIVACGDEVYSVSLPR